ncbi:MAG: Rieske 2Fe-2S domain-containing protein [Acidobacteria bacterium]|nr:Rieske 2Fe-2S domain-containing protein [Acidobacteriota bacterium]
MRSAASLPNGHPIHPALVPFPLALFYAATVADLAGRLAGWQGWWAAAGTIEIAGVVTGLVAAVPGLIDYFRTVPPNSSGKKRATRHLLANVSAMGMFLAAWMARPADPSAPPGVAVIGLEVLGTVLVSAGGYIGGTLAYRNQIGVDHRYAGSGKWREATIEQTSGELVVGKVDELEPNQMKLLRVGGRRIVLGRTEEGYVAFEDHCTHKGGSLAGGTVICGTVACPWHGSQFDTKTGAVKAGPAGKPVSTYAVECRNGEVRLRL